MEQVIGSAYTIFYPLVEVSMARVAEFQALTSKVLGIVFPDDYIQRAETYALMDSEHHICGGMIVANQPPFRCLQSIPKESNWEVLEKLGCLEDCAEVNGVWIAPEHKSAFVSTAFWKQMIDVLLKSQKQRFLFTVDHSNRHMLGHVAFLQPEVLYSGATVQLEGMQQVANEVILSIQRDMVEAAVDFFDRFGTGQRVPADLEVAQLIAKRRDAAALLAAFDQATQC